VEYSGTNVSPQARLLQEMSNCISSFWQAMQKKVNKVSEGCSTGIKEQKCSFLFASKED
jgi:hypothetical protein